MMKRINSPKFLFAVLKLVSLVAILAGICLSLNCGVIQVVTNDENAPAIGYVVTALLNCMLWWISWGSFMGICNRLMKDDTAFTPKNSAALQIIGKCVAMMAGVMCLRALPELLVQPDAYLLIEAIILPGTFLTVSMLAFILSRLLDHAMALEEEQADVV